MNLGERNFAESRRRSFKKIWNLQLIFSRDLNTCRHLGSAVSHVLWRVAELTQQALLSVEQGSSSLSSRLLAPLGVCVGGGGNSSVARCNLLKETPFNPAFHRACGSRGRHQAGTRSLPPNSTLLRHHLQISGHFPKRGWNPLWSSHSEVYSSGLVSVADFFYKLAHCLYLWIMWY